MLTHHVRVLQFAEMKQLVEQREHEWVRELKEAEGERLSGLAEHMEMLSLVILRTFGQLGNS